MNLRIGNKKNLVMLYNWVVLYKKRIMIIVVIVFEYISIGKILLLLLDFEVGFLKIVFFIWCMVWGFFNVLFNNIEEFKFLIY